MQFIYTVADYEIELAQFLTSSKQFHWTDNNFEHFK